MLIPGGRAGGLYATCTLVCAAHRVGPLRYLVRIGQRGEAEPGSHRAQPGGEGDRHRGAGPSAEGGFVVGPPGRGSATVARPGRCSARSRRQCRDHDRPTSSPSESMSMRSAAAEVPSPGMVRISPQLGEMNPAPTLARTSRTGSRQPVGAPSRVGSDEIDRWVFGDADGQVAEAVPLVMMLHCGRRSRCWRPRSTARTASTTRLTPPSRSTTRVEEVERRGLVGGFGDCL